MKAYRKVYKKLEKIIDKYDEDKIGDYNLYEEIEDVMFWITRKIRKKESKDHNRVIPLAESMKAEVDLPYINLGKPNEIIVDDPNPQIVDDPAFEDMPEPFKEKIREHDLTLMEGLLLDIIVDLLNGDLDLNKNKEV